MDGVGYVRVSTGRQAANGISVDAQKSAILACGEAKGINITEWFQDAVSGGEEKRPSFQKMMDKALAKNTPIKAIVVFSGNIIDRLATLKAKIMATGIQTKKRFLRAIVSAVVVRCDSIEIIGSNGGLVDAVTGSSIGALRPEPPVRGFGREWCGRPGSNRHGQCPTDFHTTSTFAAGSGRKPFVVWTIPSS